MLVYLTFPMSNLKSTARKCYGDIHLVACGPVLFNTTFNNSSVILLRSVLLVEETGGSGENHRPAASH